MSATEDSARDRRLAQETNNLAWTLVENPARTPEQDDEMVHAAHASAFFWSRVGRDLQQARAAMLLGLVHAQLGNGTMALRYAERSFAYVTSHDSPDWEVAFAHATLAHAAYASGDLSRYAHHYAEAKSLGAQIAEDGERAMFEKTFSQIPEVASAAAV